MTFASCLQISQRVCSFSWCWQWPAPSSAGASVEPWALGPCPGWQTGLWGWGMLAAEGPFLSHAFGESQSPFSLGREQGLLPASHHAEFLVAGLAAASAAYWIRNPLCLLAGTILSHFWGDDHLLYFHMSLPSITLMCSWLTTSSTFVWGLL